MTDRFPPREPESRGLSTSLLMSPLLWGSALTFGFYALIPELPAYRELAERYFCGHPIEYATTALFFVASAMLVLKRLGLSHERAAFEFDTLPGDEALADRSALVASLGKRLTELPRRVQGTILVTRLRDIVAYLRQNDSPTAVEEHLRYLAERDESRVHSSYALVRTITWAIPILGFLGTVIGITLAVANISPDQLQNSLTSVIGGLSVAFDTTALALTLSLFLVFGTFAVERQEHRILADVEDFGIRHIAGSFSGGTGSARGPLHEAETQAAEELLARSREMIDYQTRVWRESLDAMRQSWLQSLTLQERDLRQWMGESLQQSLRAHERSLDESRGEFLDAFQGASRLFAHSVNESRELQQTLQRDLQVRMESFLGEWRGECERSSRSLDEHTQSSLRTVLTELKTWQNQVQSSTEVATAQMQELRKQTDTLNRLLEHEESLASLQQRLSHNLAAVTAGNKLEEVLHNLNAAIHLMTARSLPRAA